MTIYTIQQVLAVKERYREAPYKEFSLQNVCRKHIPSKLVRGNDAYHARRATTSDDAIRKTVQASLNKLAQENYAEILETLQSDMLLEDTAIEIFVQLVFQKAISEPAYSPMYAQLCYDMAKYEVNNASCGPSPSYSGVGEAAKTRSRFRDCIVLRSQKEFQDGDAPRAQDGMSAEEEEEERIVFARRKKANIKFVGQLFLRKVLSERIMHQVIHALIHMTGDEVASYYPPDINIEVLSELLATIGERVESTADGVQRMQMVISRIEYIMAREVPYTARIHFKMMDILDLRRKGWVQKGASQQQANTQKRTVTAKSPAVFTPTRRGMMKFPDSPTPGNAPSNMSPTNTNPTPGGWRGMGTRVASTGATPTIPAVPRAPPPVPLEKKLAELEREWGGVGSGPLVNWQPRFVLYNMSEDELATAVINHAATEACTTTKKDAQEETAAFFTEALEFSVPELVRGLSKTLAKAVEECIFEDSPKFIDRFVVLFRAAAACDDNVPQLMRLATSVLFAAMDRIVDTEAAEDEPVDALVAVWRKLPPPTAEEPQLLTSILQARGIGALPSQLAAGLVTLCVEQGRFSKAKVEEWAASPQAAAAKEVRALLQEGGLLKE